MPKSLVPMDTLLIVAKNLWWFPLLVVGLKFAKVAAELFRKFNS